ncbi:MAG: hypothetical protein JSR60_05315 [Proteobacteria bacterium]|nr:hypothetical protein [Pseudomonadota bacterium]
MSDDSDLIRLFAEDDSAISDEAFVSAVSARIRMRQYAVLAVPTLLTALLLAAVWATWPAAYVFSTSVMSGLATLGAMVGTLANSQLGMTVALTLVATGLLWAWLFERFVARD